MVYRLLRLLLRHALSVFFRSIEIEGRDGVPPDGPLLLAANHPNTLIDVLLVATRLDRKVGFVGKATLFQNPLANFVFRFLGAVPIHRRQDGPVEGDQAAKNAAALSSCIDAVAAGGAILIFPEGVSREEPRLQKLKTGLARIALGAEEKAPGQVVVVPTALVYDDQETFRSRARVTFAPPVPAAPFLELGRKAGDPFVGVRAYTEAVRQALVPELVHVEDSELDAFARRLDALYGHRASAEAGGRLAASAILTRALNAFAAEQPERVAAMKSEVAAYEAALAEAGVGDGVVRDQTRRPSLLADVGFVLGAPFALWGALNHFVLYQIPRLVLRFVPSDPTETSTAKLLLGLLGLVATYVIQGYGVYAFAPEAAASPATLTLLYLLTLPITGLAALVWGEACVRRGGLRRARRARRRLPRETLAGLAAQRASLIAKLDAARADYLALQLDAGDAEADEPW